MWKAAFTALALLWTAPAVAHEIKVGNLTVVHPFVRATPPSARVAGGYLKIRNDGDEDDRLLMIEAPTAAGRVTLHTTVVTDGTASMELLAGLLIPAHGEAILGADGTHAMFEDLTAPIGLGQLVDATLIFEKAGTVELSFEVEPMTANPLEVIHAH